MSTKAVGKKKEKEKLCVKELALKYGFNDFAKSKKHKLSVEDLTEDNKPLVTVSFDIFNDESMKNPVVYKNTVEPYSAIID